MSFSSSAKELITVTELINIQSRTDGNAIYLGVPLVCRLIFTLLCRLLYTFAFVCCELRLNLLRKHLCALVSVCVDTEAFLLVPLQKAFHSISCTNYRTARVFTYIYKWVSVYMCILPSVYCICIMLLLSVFSILKQRMVFIVYIFRIYIYHYE